MLSLPQLLVEVICALLDRKKRRVFTVVGFCVNNSRSASASRGMDPDCDARVSVDGLHGTSHFVCDRAGDSVHRESNLRSFRSVRRE